MLVETAVFLRSLAAAPPGFRRNLYGAVGLWARGVRQAKAWAPHIAHTRGLLDVAIDDIAPRRTVAILGSGPLFDAPLEALARTFDSVVLVDHAHLVTIGRRLRRYDNVALDWRDLSPISTPDPLAFLAQRPGIDWVISLNLLSQLASGAPEAQRREVVDNHLDGLGRLPCRTTLVTDVDYRIVDRGGRLIEQADLLHGRPMPPPDATWKWEVAPFGEEARNTRRVHTVSAWLDWRAGD